MGAFVTITMLSNSLLVNIAHIIMIGNVGGFGLPGLVFHMI